MNYGLRAAAQAMNLGTYKQDIISNNIANANTTGFKANDAFTIALNKKTSAHNGTQPFDTTDKVMYSTYTDHTDGNMKNTNRDLDLAINGNGHFLMRKANGIELSRRGDFKIGLQGTIVNGKGDHLLASKGIIEVEEDMTNLVINKSGEIYMNGEYYDTLMLTDIDNPSANLHKKPNGLYELKGPMDYTWESSNENKIYQGYLEESNVNSLKEMVKMIENEKSFNMNQKIIQAIDSTLNISVNQIGKV